EKKGWIEAEHGRPSRYFPKPPSEAIETTKLRMEGVLKLSESAILDDLQPVYDKKEVRERPDIWIVRGEYNILAKIRETFSNAKKELMIAVPVLPQQAFDLLYPILVRLKEQSVKIAIMAGKDIPRDLQKRMKDIAEVRVREKMFGGGAVSDTREVILLLGEARAGESALAIWSDHIGLAKFAKGYFEFLWATEARKA
ncbi:MAG: TrmB family transcriptional regulator, partial [Candidatus Bathyarchaeia archaeon]